MEKESIGKIIKEIRESKGISQNKLSEISGIDRSYINQLESGKRGGISLKTAQAIAKALNVDPGVFFASPYPSKMPIASLLKEISERMELVEIPIRGSVPAGMPFTQEQEAGEFVEIPRQLLGSTRPENAYALKISGDSLLGDGIYSGDTAVVDTLAKDITDGKIYIVRIGTEVCARHVYKRDSYLRLISSNGEYKDILATEVEILGRLIASGRWEKH